MPPRRALTTVWFDTLCAGGLSILILGAFFALDIESMRQWRGSKIIVLTTLINFPHFIASYRLLYGSREMIREYRWSSFYIPGLLILWSTWAVASAMGSSESYVAAELMFQVVSVYLAVHYTGQVWGTMSTFAHLEGLAFDTRERWIFLVCLRVFLVWHVIWAMRMWDLSAGVWDLSDGWLASALPVASAVINVAAVAAALLGAVGFALFGLRTRRVPPLRIVVPFVAICMWYAFFYVYPGGAIWVQVFHALQYMIFPVRVEINRTIARHPGVGSGGLTLHMIFYFATMVVLGYFVFQGVGDVLQLINSRITDIGIVVGTAVNIHHYYVDGSVWKMSNPRVRAELFAHLRG